MTIALFKRASIQSNNTQLTKPPPPSVSFFAREGYPNFPYSSFERNHNLPDPTYLNGKGAGLPKLLKKQSSQFVLLRLVRSLEY